MKAVETFLEAMLNARLGEWEGGLSERVQGAV